MLYFLNQKFRRLCSNLRWSIRPRSRSKVIIKRFGKSSSKQRNEAKFEATSIGSSTVHPNAQLGFLGPEKSVRIATFNASLFSMAPAIPNAASFHCENEDDEDAVTRRESIENKLRNKSMNDAPKSILKQSPLRPSTINSADNLTRQQKFAKSKLRVSINLPDNEISSLLRNRKSGFVDEENAGTSIGNKCQVLREKAPLRSTVSSYASTRTVLEVLRELDADILALQDVKAEEEKAMKPLSDLAAALGMNYVFAESWAPEYGNAVLSKWPIKRSKVQKIFDDTDFRNVLKATIDVPMIGELNFQCTLLDHLDEKWRMKQINSIIQSDDQPHILAGGLNSLDETDYSTQRWTDIVKYYEEMGKPTPKAEVMRFLKSKQYIDAKEFAGECESVVVIAKGQSVQGTCKYGTRVDYILGSRNSPYEFVPGSYTVLSSKGTSDHHIVKVEVTKGNSNTCQENVAKKHKQRVIKISNSSPSKGIWKLQR